MIRSERASWTVAELAAASSGPAPSGRRPGPRYREDPSKVNLRSVGIVLREMALRFTQKIFTQCEVASPG
jgi:hypothetical protein